MPSVLIVDDDADLRLLTRRMLGKMGCEVAEASNGSEGEAKALEIMPELILLDIMMPGQDGYETCANLRSRGYAGSIVLVSALQQASVLTHIENCGANAYIQKPINRETLRLHVDHASSQPTVQ
jgi:two-component system response regulator YcbB